VYHRGAVETAWTPYDVNYPAGMQVNIALPFYRDSKIRVAGNAGIWEIPFAEEAFTPIVNPWVDRPVNNCMEDTLCFDDHSILNHAGAEWEWQFTPEPMYVSNRKVRNPKVVLGTPGSYSVTLKVAQNGQSYGKTVDNMVRTTTCPSLSTCDNPATVPLSGWSLLYADSEEINYPGLARMAFDDDPATIWHTRWSTGNDAYPHEIQVDMGREYNIHRFTLLPRQDGVNGRIKNYELYVTNNKLVWGAAVKTGSFENSASPQTISFATPVNGRNFKLKALSEANGNPWASVAEISVVGCYAGITAINEVANRSGEKDGPGSEIRDLHAWPVPSSGKVTIPLPSGPAMEYQIITLQGHLIAEGTTSGLNSVGSNTTNGTFRLDLSGVAPGVYLVILTGKDGSRYRVKIVKN